MCTNQFLDVTLIPSCVVPERRSARFSFSSRKKTVKTVRSVVFRSMTNPG